MMVVTNMLIGVIIIMIFAVFGKLLHIHEVLVDIAPRLDAIRYLLSISEKERSKKSEK